MCSVVRLYITNDIEIIGYGINGLRFVGLLQFADAVSITLWFALSGAGNTIFPGTPLGDPRDTSLCSNNKHNNNHYNSNSSP